MIDPLLACSKQPNIDKLNYPVIASYKLDGIRCLTNLGVGYSRNKKPIPNTFVQNILQMYNLHGTDGELVLVNNGSFNSVQSAIMSSAGTPNFRYVLFDKWDNFTLPYEQRLAKLHDYVGKLDGLSGRVSVLAHATCYTPEDVAKMYTEATGAGYEGLILRDRAGMYKRGRSTMREGIMLKLKPEEDAEGVIVGFKELMRNADTSCKLKDNMVPAGILGSFIVETGSIRFDVGSGFNSLQRHSYWQMRNTLLGKTITYKYQERFPTGAPRFPVFKGFRYD